MKNILLLTCSLLLFFIAGCTPVSPITTPESPIASPSLTATFTATLPPTASPTATLPPTPTTEISTHICSPVQGIELSKLHLIESNPFKSPPPYHDENGHPALDIGAYHFEDYPFFPNFPVQSILPGKVILVENDRFPYGNMVMVEIPFSQIDPTFLATISQPTPLPPSIYSTNDICLVNGNPVSWDSEGKSIYVLYAHLAQLPELQIGDSVSCGQHIGVAGKSGNAAEEHLHLEIRVGPSNAKFISIASQHSSVTNEERYNYCIWALSGVFQAIDPAVLLYP